MCDPRREKASNRETETVNPIHRIEAMVIYLKHRVLSLFTHFKSVGASGHKV